MEKRKKGRKWLAAALALMLLVIGCGGECRAAALPASESPAVLELAVSAGIPMQAVVPVHVRTGPGVQWQSIGVLAQGQTVSVLETDPSGWQMIRYNGADGYVNGAYLTPVQAVQPPAVQTEIPGAAIVFIGDSRFVQMEEAVGENPYVWIAESGKGLDWFEEKGVQRADAVIGTGTRVLINLGVNDVRNIDRYITFFNQKAAEWTLRGAVVYYASVNPVWTNPYVTKEQVEAFNRKLQADLAPYVIWIDSYSWLQAVGLRIVDGLHYDESTYRNLYAYYLMNCAGTTVPAVPAALM